METTNNNVFNLGLKFAKEIEIERQKSLVPDLDFNPNLYDLTKKSGKKGIVTIGPRNIEFRSRIEAKYALFWDFLKWGWDYEPIDLKGYIPDFRVYPTEDRGILIEIKGDRIAYEFRAAAEKLASSGFLNTCVFLGPRSPYINSSSRIVLDGRASVPSRWKSDSNEAWFFRDGLEFYGDKRAGVEWQTIKKIFLSFCNHCEIFTLCSESQCLVCNGKSLQRSTKSSKISKMKYNVIKAWSNFCNKTKWDPSKKLKKETDQNLTEKIKKTIPDAISQIHNQQMDYNVANEIIVGTSCSSKSAATLIEYSRDNLLFEKKFEKVERFNGSPPREELLDIKFHSTCVEDAIIKIVLQYDEKGVAVLCIEHINFWEELLEWLEDVAASYSVQNGLCCGKYVYIDEIPES